MRAVRAVGPMALLAYGGAWVIMAVPPARLTPLIPLIVLLPLLISMLRRRPQVQDQRRRLSVTRLLMLVLLLFGAWAMFFALWIVVGALTSPLWQHGLPYWVILGSELVVCFAAIRAGVRATFGAAFRTTTGEATSS